MYKSKRSERGGGGDRSSSPITKRSRSTLGRYGDPDSDDEPERGRARSPVASRGRDYYDSGSRPGAGGAGGGYKESHHSSSSSSRPYPYKVLCISSLHGKASDEAVRETLYREFKRFGEISVKVVHEPDERVAYVYFRTYEDARDAKHSKSRILVFDKPVMIEAAYESSSSNSAPASYKPPVADSYGDRDRDRGYGGGGGGGNYRRSPHPLPPPPAYERGHRDERGGGGGYDRYHGPPSHQHHPPPPQPFMRHQEYRRDPHEYGGGGGGGGRGHHQPMYAPRYDNYSNSNRYPPVPPPGPRGPPMQQSGGPGGDRGGSYENKKDKFPNYLHHVNPEDDPLATRTLFAGNLEVNISDEEMRRIFGRYGTVEDIDIKRPPPGTGNAYAFVRYANLDMAARAKTELSGQYIGKFQCKIGYGKVNPTTKIWVGGLGPWASLAALEREFDRFGSIKKVEWIKGDHQAFITYETIDAAQAAVKDMRGYPLGGTEKRIRTDFAGVEQIVGYAGEEKPYDYGRNAGGGDSRNRGASAGSGRRGSSNVVLTGGNEATTPTANNSGHSSDIGSSPSDSESTAEKKKSGARNGSSASSLATVKTVVDITKKQAAGWQGSLILKNSAFPAKLHITDGDYESVSALMKDEDGKSQLRITQRLRLDQTKLEDVTRRMSSSTGFGVFLAWPVSIASPMSSPNAGSSPVQSRPLKNLVSYLKQKEAAGVISLANRSVDSTGVLYAFPPCAYSTKLLQKTCPAIEESSDDYLLVVVIKGGTA